LASFVAWRLGERLSFLILLLASPVIAADNSPTHAQHVLFLADHGLAVVRVSVNIDGQSVTSKNLPPLRWEFTSQRTARITDAGELQDRPLVDRQLFSRLDTDGNRLLTERELAAAATVLSLLDFDEDELITADELTPQARASGPQRGMPVAAVSRGDASLIPLPSRVDAVFTRRVFTQYDVAPKDLRLARQEVHVAQHQFSTGDADGDGSWDFDELRRFLERPVPSAEISVRVVSGMETAAQCVIHDADAVKMLVDEPSRLQFEILKTRFDWRLPTIIVPADAQLVLTVNNLGKTFFGRLDTNADGRLSLRELTGIEKQIPAWDENSDGKLDESEFPHQYRITLGFGVQAAEMEQLVEAAMVTLPTIGPVWFRKQDRNRDGEVSSREFLGLRERFQKIDANSDGAIDVEEAGTVK